MMLMKEGVKTFIMNWKNKKCNNMGQSTYYHNLTKKWFNENDYCSAVENSEVGDVIKMSFRGNALVIDLLKENIEIESNGEHDWARKQFLDYFKEFHEVDFINN